MARSIPVNGEKIRTLREKHCLTQEQLAAHADCSKGTIENAEKGRSILRGYAKDIATALEVEVSEIILHQPDLKAAKEESSRTKLTPTDPTQSAKNTKLFCASASCDEIEAVPNGNPPECAWVVQWPGINAERIRLNYQSERIAQVSDEIADLAESVIDGWKPEMDDNRKLDIEREPPGVQIRLDRCNKIDHGDYDIRLDLSPTNYHHYVAIQARLWDSRSKEIVKLRDFAFANALVGLANGTTQWMPSHFALHMAVVSSDNCLLLRQRRKDTELYPLAWEVGIGEFCHGPQSEGPFPHCLDGKPDLELFLKNAVAEELNFNQAKIDQFKVFGFAVEYRTLAPKLIVVYKSTATIKALAKGTLNAEDFGNKADWVDLSVDGLKEAFYGIAEYPRWGPTSKLAAVLALLNNSPPNNRGQILKHLKMP